ncbi:MAG: tryptophan--tRNA ligase, partial [Nitrospiraceae bacterium]
AEGCRTAGIGCIDCKKVLIKNLLIILEPIWERRNNLLHNPDHLEAIIEAGSEKAAKAASETMEMVRQAMKLIS